MRLFDDLELLLELGAGTIEIDVLRDASVHGGEPLAELRIAGELSAWLAERPGVRRPG